MPPAPSWPRISCPGNSGQVDGPVPTGAVSATPRKLVVRSLAGLAEAWSAESKSGIVVGPEAFCAIGSIFSAEPLFMLRHAPSMARPVRHCVSRGQLLRRLLQRLLPAPLAATGRPQPTRQPPAAPKEPALEPASCSSPVVADFCDAGNEIPLPIWGWAGVDRKTFRRFAVGGRRAADLLMGSSFRAPTCSPDSPLFSPTTLRHAGDTPPHTFARFHARSPGRISTADTRARRSSAPSPRSLWRRRLALESDDRTRPTHSSRDDSPAPPSPTHEPPDWRRDVSDA